ncbi:MAG: lysozyme [Gammaproteobacteria bacterium]|nr:lysozyme [Gammaproteobacteria bacterium]
MNKWLVIAILAAAGMLLMRTSKAGIRKIQVHEALSLTPYKDVSGAWHIGYGHKLKPGEDYLRAPAGITRDQAEALLRADLADAEKAVNELVKVKLTANQYDALVSFVYNIGSGAFSTSTMLKLLNQGKYDKAAAEFPRWVNVGRKQVAALVARRAQEQSLFLT